MKKVIYIILTTALLILIGQSIYKQLNKTGAKAVRLECHKSSTVFEKVIKKDFLKQLKSDINTGNIKVNISVEKAKYTESSLFSFVDPQKIKNEFEKLLNSNINNNSNSSVDILIYENDKGDPGKKTAKSKLYAGYLVFSFKYNNKLTYKLQIDFHDHEGKDITKVLKCALKSIKTIKGE